METIYVYRYTVGMDNWVLEKGLEKPRDYTAKWLTIGENAIVVGIIIEFADVNNALQFKLTFGENIDTKERIQQYGAERISWRTKRS